MTDNAGLRGFSKALSLPLDDHVVETLRDIAVKCVVTQQPRPNFTVPHSPVHWYDTPYTLKLLAHTSLCDFCLKKQEAQLSQRDCMMLLVIEHFAKSLKVTQGHSK